MEEPIKKPGLDSDLLEDLLAAGNSDYLDSIKEARADAQAGRLLTSEALFGQPNSAAKTESNQV